jgi:hypothetical protein
MLELLSLLSTAYFFCGDDLRSNFELAQIAMNRNPFNYYHLSSGFKNTPEFIDVFVKAKIDPDLMKDYNLATEILNKIGIDANEDELPF